MNEQNWKELERDMLEELHSLIEVDETDIDEVVRTSLRNYNILFGEVKSMRQQYNILWKSYAELRYRR
jgi:hypothetical protein